MIASYWDIYSDTHVNVMMEFESHIKENILLTSISASLHAEKITVVLTYKHKWFSYLNLFFQVQWTYPLN